MSKSLRDANPFPGLRPFETEEYLLFFGREGQSDELLARLARTRFLAVVGTSGSGKSSLVRAGLLPALRGGLMKGASSGWRIAVMRPGHDPVGNLACALSAKGVLAGAGGGLDGAEAEAFVEATLRAGSLGLADAARQARLGEHDNLLVVVDQFEELFRFRAARSGTADDAAAFVKLLLEASRQRELNIYVVITMRSDFLGDCAQFQGLPEAINDGQYLIPRMTRDERRVAITGPVAVARGRVAEPLVSRLLNDVGDNPDQLPILQHALMRTWDYWKQHRRDGEPIGVEHYEAVGTMADALSRHADEAWAELPDDRGREIAEKMFRALTERGADNRETRRPTRLREISEIVGAGEAEVAAVIEVFRRPGRSFLMPPAGVELSAETIIDISHESLIRNWQRLKGWVADEAQSVRVYRRLAEAAVLHREGGEGLMQDPALEIALDWRERSRPNAAWGRHYHPEFELAVAYLEESRAARDAAAAERERLRREEIERERREREQAERFAAQQSRSARRMRRLTFAMILLAFLSAGAAVYALSARAAAVRSRVNAELSQAAAERSQAEAIRALDDARRSRERAEASERSAVEARGVVEKSLEALQSAQSKLLAQTKAAELSARQARQANARTQIALEFAQKERDAAVIARGEAAAALDRGKSFRTGLEAYRREEFKEAREVFERVRAELETIQQGIVAPPGRPVFEPEQARQYTEDLGWTLSNIGATYQQESDFAAAKESYVKALGFIEGSAKPSDPIRLDTYDGLGHSYRALATNYKSGTPEDFDRAEDFFKRALAFQKEHRREKPAEAAGGYLNLARLYTDRGNLDEAEKHFKCAAKLLGRRGKVGGPDEAEDCPAEPGGAAGEADRLGGDKQRAALTPALRELAEFYQGPRDRSDDAIRVFNEIISLQEEGDLAALGQELANSYGDLWQAHAARRDEASRAAGQLAAAAKPAYDTGPDAEKEKAEKAKAEKDEEAKLHARKAEDASRIANLLQRIALRLRQRGKAQAREGSSTLVKDLTADLDELGDAYVAAGKLDDAEKVYRKALEDREGTVERFVSYHKLKTFYAHRKKDDAKFKEYQARFDGADPNKPEVAPHLTRLAAAYSPEPSRAPEAEAAYEDALALYRGRDWMNENTVLFNLDELHRKRKNPSKRRDAVRRRLQTLTAYFERLTGPEDKRPAAPALLVSEYLNAVERAAFVEVTKADAETGQALRRAFAAFDLITATYPSKNGLKHYAGVLARYEALLNKEGQPEEAAVVREKRCRFDEACKQKTDSQLQQGPSPSATLTRP